MSRARTVIALVLAGALASGLSCDTVIHRPGVACDRDEDCAAPRAHCELSAHLCVEPGDGGGPQDGAAPLDGAVDDLALPCTTATAASVCVDPGAPICESASCRACSGEADDTACTARSPSTPLCMPSGSNAGHCVACLPSTPLAETLGCGVTTPVCGEDGACRGCQSHSECASGLCAQEGVDQGRCIPANQVALVDNAGSSAAACMSGRPLRDGSTPATAYCDLPELVSAARAYAFVKGSDAPYSPVALTNQSLTLIGPPSGANPGVRLLAVGQDAVALTVTSGAHTVVLEGFQLGGSAGMLATHGVNLVNNTGVIGNANVALRRVAIGYCSMAGVSTSMGTVTVRGSQIGPCGGSGVSSLGGALTVTGCFISGNADRGIYANTGTATIARGIVSGNGGGGVQLIAVPGYTIENVAVLANAAPGVSLDAASNGVFRFNSVVKNTSSTSAPGGVVCGAASKTLSASIVIDNSKGATSQFSGACALDGVVTGADSALGAIMKTPSFVGAFDARLVAGDVANQDCCVDKRASGPVSDSNGVPRPKGAGYDIGAYEVE